MKHIKINTSNKISISFSFDSLDILTAIDNDVYVKADLFYANEEKCILILSRKLFLTLLKLWLDEKKMYYKNWKHFCGVGSVNIDKFKNVKKTMSLLIDFDEKDNKNIYKEVRIFRAISGSIDMEHG